MFGFPISEKPESLRFASNILQTATFQLQYQAVDSVDRRAEIIELVRVLMPKIRAIREQTVFLSAQDDTPVVKPEEQVIETGVEFKTESDDMAFTVKNDSMTLVIAGGSYTHFQEALQYIEKTLYSIANLLNITQFTRVAIRKVNVIGVRPNDVSKQNFNKVVQDVFNESLVGPATQLPSADSLNAYVTNSYFVDGCNNLNLIYGLLPQQGNTQDRQLLLDIDIFHSRNNILVDESKSLLLEINNELFNVFMWSLNPVVKALLQQQRHPNS